jgi:pyruvate dehydrogenase E1 component alpha subunit
VRNIRRVEEEIARIYPTDKIKSPVHLSIGQEAAAVGVCDALNPDDVVSGTYRGHAVYLAKGGSLPAMMAELFGKRSGCAAGRGGSMHLVDMSNLILGTSAVVGTTVPIAAGYAMALKREAKGRVVAAFFGDGATEEGSFYETLNFAALHHLPMLFVCENNFYAIHTPLSKRWASPDICARVESFGVRAQKVESGDVFAIRAVAAKAVESLREGSGPLFLEIHSYRLREHVGPNEDFSAGYRAPEEAAVWRERDQVARAGALVPEAERALIDRDIERAIQSAIEFAEASPFPDPSELEAHAYA